MTRSIYRRGIRDLRRAINDPLSRWPINRIGGGAAFTPLELFGSGESGGWYDPSDLATLFQERTGASATTPAGVGDPVGTVLDKSGNDNHLTAPSDSARPTLGQTSDGKYYLSFDGVDDALALGFNIGAASTNWTVALAVGNGDFDTSTDGRGIIFGGTDYVLAPHIGDSAGAIVDTNFTVNSWRSDGAAETTPTTRNNLALAIEGDGLSPYTYFQMHYTVNTAGSVTSVGGFTGWNPLFECFALVIIDRALTASEQTSLDAFLKTKPMQYLSVYDVFLISGQSNAEGRGDSGTSPNLSRPRMSYEATASSVAELDDPVGGAQFGSAWPAFANEWYSQTGRGSIFVEAAVGGSALLNAAAATSAQDWSDLGDAKAAAESLFANAQSYVTTNYSDRLTLGNLYALWCQGEREAQNINGTTITGALYQAALEDLIDEWEVDLGLTRFCIFRTGVLGSDVNDVNWEAIRDAQDAAQANRSSTSLVVYRGAVTFVTEGWMNVDNIHYLQAGLDDMGTNGAINLAAGTNDAEP